MKPNYTNKQKNLLRKPEESVQPIEFAGIVNGKISPSDIDAVIEIDDKYLIMIEVKKFGNELSTGQKLLMQRIVEAWNSCPGKHGIAIYATHTVYDANETIYLKDCVAKGVYDEFSNKHDWRWREPDVANVKELINKFGKAHNCLKLRF